MGEINPGPSWDAPHTPEWLAAYLRAWADNAPWDTRDEQVLREAADALIEAEGRERMWELLEEIDAALAAHDFDSEGSLRSRIRAALPLTEETPDADA